MPLEAQEPHNEMSSKKQKTGGKQQTLASAFSRGQALQKPSLVVENTVEPPCIPERLWNTKRTEYEHYARGSPVLKMGSIEGPAAVQYHAATRHSLRIKKEVIDDVHTAQEDLHAHGEQSWERQGARFVEGLEQLVRQGQALSIQLQEYLVHMLLNHDFHVTNLSLRAFRLLKLNAELHPPCKRGSAGPGSVLVNPLLWLPCTPFRFEGAACPTIIAGTSANAPYELLHALWRVAQAMCPPLDPVAFASGPGLPTGPPSTGAGPETAVEVPGAGAAAPAAASERAGSGGGAAGGSSRPGSGGGAAGHGAQGSQGLTERGTVPWMLGGEVYPAGVLLLLQYALLLLRMDLEVRMEVLERLRGDSRAHLMVQHSLLWRLMASGGPQVWIGPTKNHPALVRSLVSVVLAGQVDSAASSAASTSQPAGPQVVPPSELAAQAGWLLGALYDTFTAAEGFPRELYGQSARTSDRAALAEELLLLLEGSRGAGRELGQDTAALVAVLREPSARLALLSMLSPPSRLHLLGMAFVGVAERAWSTGAAGSAGARGVEGLELGLPPGHLADLKEHRQRRGLPAGDAAAAAMRGSAVQVDASEVLRALADPQGPLDLYDAATKMLFKVPGAAAGERGGFVGWLAAFARASAEHLTSAAAAAAATGVQGAGEAGGPASQGAVGGGSQGPSSQGVGPSSQGGDPAQRAAALKHEAAAVREGLEALRLRMAGEKAVVWAGAGPAADLAMQAARRVVQAM